MCSSLFRTEELLERILMNAGTDYAQAACCGSTAMTHIGRTGHIVKVNPLAVLACHNTLGTEYHTIGIGIGQGFQRSGDFIHCIGLRCFRTPACKYIVRMVMVMIMTAAGAVFAVLVMMMLMIVAAAGAVLAMLVMMMLMLMTAAVLAMLVMVMLMIVAAAVFTMLVMVMLMIVTAAGAVLAVLVMVMLMIVTVAVLAMFVMVVVVRLLMEKSLELVIECMLLSHSLHKLSTGELIPVGCDDGSCGVAGTQTLHAVIELILRETGCVAENQAACVSDLVVKEFAEVLLVHLALLGVNHSGEAIKNDVVCINILHGLDDIAELTYAGRFDENAVGLVVSEYLFECLAEIADETAADAAGIHLCDLHTGILQEAAVNADLAEFILDEHELFALVAFGNELFDQGCFTRTEKAGENRNLCHKSTLLS